MKIIETLNEGLKREYEITVPADVVSNQYSNEIQEISANFKLPGFRAGKVPLEIVKKQHHKAIVSKILQNIIEEHTFKLFQDKNINPVEQPQIDISSYEDNKDLSFKIAVETFPEISIPEMSEIEIEKIIAEADEQHADKAINELATNNKNYTKSSKSAAKENMAVLIDYEGKVDNVSFEGGKGEGYTLILGSNTFIPGFEEQLIGSKKGDEKTVKVTFPEKYHVENLAGKEAEFVVKVKDVMSATDSIVDDEFAKKFGLKDLADLKSSVKTKLNNDIREISKTNMKKSLFDHLEDKCDFPLPESIVEKEFNLIWDNYQQSPEAKSSDKSQDLVRAEFKKLAERRVKLGMLIAEIGKLEKIQIAQSDVRDAMLKQARMFAGQENIVLEYYKKNPKALDSLKGPILEDKVVEYLFTKVKINERTIPADDFLEQVKKGEL